MAKEKDTKKAKAEDKKEKKFPDSKFPPKKKK
jgi:hypothetical protein